jgi:putative ABC transport system substrate-binding protein
VNRRDCLRLLALASTAGATAAWGDRRRRRVGMLTMDPDGPTAEDRAQLRQILAEFGYVEGRDIEVVVRSCTNANMDEVARQLAAGGFDVLATVGTAATHALQRATTTIPIVTSVADPVASGFAKSLARPGGNITGLSQANSDAVVKQLEVLRQLVPGLSRIAICLRRTASAPEIARPLQREAQRLNIATELFQVIDLAGYEAAFKSLQGARARGAWVSVPSVSESEVGSLAQLAIRLRVPIVTSEMDFVKAGALASYEIYHRDGDRAQFALIDRVLHGANPATLPFELPRDSRLTLNRATAAALGISIPKDLLLRANAVYG